MQRTIGGVDPSLPCARVGPIVELVVNLAAVDEGQLHRTAGDHIALGVEEGQCVATDKDPAEQRHRASLTAVWDGCGCYAVQHRSCLRWRYGEAVVAGMQRTI